MSGGPVLAGLLVALAVCVLMLPARREPPAGLGPRRPGGGGLVCEEALRRRPDGALVAGPAAQSLDALLARAGEGPTSGAEPVRGARRRTGARP